MVLRITTVLFCAMLLSCIEKYTFRIKNNSPSLVVEASISDVSYNETVSYPSDGRYFTVRLRETNDVINLRDNVVSNAVVKLVDSQDQEWLYTEQPEASGNYYLLDKDFEALAGMEYQLQILLDNGKEYKSAWEKIYPFGSQMGDILFDEVEKFEYAIEAGEEVINAVQGINVQVEVPENDNSTPNYYLWDYEPTWVYMAPLVQMNDPQKVCWATNQYYMTDYHVETVENGGYIKDLVFIKTVRNERIFTDLSILIKQFSMSEEYYFFWKEMKEQTQSKGIFEAPPFNLKTNFTCVSDENEPVSGYFGVVEEQAKRWYFNIDNLSYNVENTLRSDCLVVYGPDGPAAQCLNCTQYSNGIATTKAPGWWPYNY